MLWVFAALACHPNDGEPTTNAHLVGSGDDTATDDSATDGSVTDDSATDDTATDTGDDSATDVDSGTEEICGNGLDDNDNGTADGCDWSGELALEGTEMWTDEEYAALGFSLAVCDANGDGVGDVVTSAPLSDSGTGAVYVFYGPVHDHGVKDADYTLTGTEKGLTAGWSLDCRGDIDGDGVADIIVAQPGSLDAAEDPGTVYIVPGGGTGTMPLADEASSAWIGSDASDGLGFQVLAIDADGDDTDELAVTPTLNDVVSNPFGIAYVFEDAGPGEFDADAAAVAYVYGEELDRIEDTIGNAGDLDSDGVEELAVTGTDEIHEELLVFGAPLVGPIAKADADTRIVGGPVGTRPLSGIGHGDLDGDGRDDLFVGDPWAGKDADGAVYAFFAPIADETDIVAADLTIVGDPHRLCGAGSDVASPGDVDGDGIPDLLVGASYGGRVYLLYGGASGVYDLAYAKDAQAWWQERIEEQFLLSAGAALAVGDVTGSGIVDFVIGSPYYGSSYRAYGRVTVVPSFQL